MFTENASNAIREWTDKEFILWIKSKIEETNPDPEMFDVDGVKVIEKQVIGTDFDHSCMIASIMIDYKHKLGIGGGFTSPAFAYLDHHKVKILTGLPFEDDMEVKLNDMIYTIMLNYHL